MNVPKKVSFKVGDLDEILIYSEDGEQYMWGEFGIDYKIVDGKIICDCESLKIDGKSVKGIELIPVHKNN